MLTARGAQVSPAAGSRLLGLAAVLATTTSGLAIAWSDAPWASPRSLAASIPSPPPLTVGNWVDIALPLVIGVGGVLAFVLVRPIAGAQVIWLAGALWLGDLISHTHLAAAGLQVTSALAVLVGGISAGVMARDTVDTGSNRTGSRSLPRGVSGVAFATAVLSGVAAAVLTTFMLSSEATTIFVTAEVLRHALIVLALLAAAASASCAWALGKPRVHTADYTALTVIAAVLLATLLSDAFAQVGQAATGSYAGGRPGTWEALFPLAVVTSAASLVSIVHLLAGSRLTVRHYVRGELGWPLLATASAAAFTVSHDVLPIELYGIFSAVMLVVGAPYFVAALVGVALTFGHRATADE